MPNDNTSYTAADFRRYAEGRMLPAERHALEKAALEDPFLADALEGYLEAFATHGPATVNTGLEAAKAALAEKTTAQPEATPVIPMRSNRWWAVAAAIAVLILAGWFLFTPADQPGNETIAVTPPAPAPAAADVVHPDTPNNSGTLGLISSNEQSDKKESAAIESLKKDLKHKLQKKQGETLIAPETIAADDTKNRDKEELEKAARDEAVQPASKKEPAASAPVTSNLLLNSFEGRVTDLNNNPLSNATVRIANTNNGVLTNDKGYFTLKSADSIVPVEVTVLGYATQNTQLRSAYNFQNTIKLPESKSTLSEVVVTTKPAADRKKEKTIFRNQTPTVMVQDAEPASGWIEFDTYLQQAKAFTTEENLLAGDVVISFQVDRNGKLSSFRIEQSLSEAQDAEAERLIKAGPSWRLLKGRKARATVIIHF